MRPILVASVSVLTSAVLTLAQAPAPSQNPPKFIGGIDVVKVDVSVYDKDRRPMKGLTAADFTVLEDKLPRPIVGLAEVDIPEPPAPTAKWMRDAPTDVATNDVAEKRLFLIVIDDPSFRPGSCKFCMDLPPSLDFKVNRDAVIGAARSVINRLGPGDLGAVVFVGDPRYNQEFSADHSRLIAAVERTLKDPPMTSPLADTTDYLYRVANDLVRTPAKRKAIVDITTDTSCVKGFGAAGFERVFKGAQEAGVRFYMMRPAAHFPICKGPYGNPQETSDLKFLAQDAAFFTAAPLETGGEAFLGVASLDVAEAAADRIFEANSSYYMLGYTSADLDKIHFVRVELNRPDAEVVTRARYFPPKEEKTPTGPPPPATLAAIADILPKTDVPLGASVAPFAAVGTAAQTRTGASVSVVLRVRQVRAEQQTGPIRETLDLRAAAFTPEGDARGATTRKIDVRLPAGSGDIDYEILHRVDLPKPGLYELRLSTHSDARKADGSVYVTVDVPDFAKEPLSLSGIVLSADNGLAIDGADTLKTLLPVTPTTVRTFDRGEPVTAFLRAYEGGSSALRPFTIHTRIIGDHDQVVLDRNETFGPERFDRTRGSQIYVRLPTGVLPPGQVLAECGSRAWQSDGGEGNQVWSPVMRILVASVSALSAVLTLAQTPAPIQNPPKFIGGIDVVKVDVSVYDKDHRPMKGLTAADFTVLEDKLPRPVVGLAEVDIPEPPAPTAKWMRDAPADVTTNDVAEKRLFLIVIDDSSKGGGTAGASGPLRGRDMQQQTFDRPQSLQYKATRNTLIGAARSVINRLGPMDLAAVVFVSDTRNNQEFTADHGRLIAAVDKTLRAEPYLNPTADAMPVLYQAVNDLIGVPAKRKAIVELTESVDCLTDFKLASAERVFKGAQQAGVRFYVMRRADHFPVCQAGNGGAAFGSGLSVADVKALAQDAAFFTRAPLETGGEAFMGVADPQKAESAASSIFEANSSYYMVGYTSADLEKIHFVKVEVNRPGAGVVTRPRYYPPKEEKTPTGPPPPATLAAIADILPKNGVPLGASVAPFAAVGTAAEPRTGASVSIVIRVRQMRPEGQTGPIRETLDLRAAAFTHEGDARGATTRKIDVRLPAGTGDIDYEILDRVDFAKPGSYELRLSTHSNARKADGSVYVMVDVPDFAKEPLSLSGLVLSADNGLAIDGADTLKTLLPVTPTTVRTFDRGEPVTAFLRAYEGGSSALRPFTIHTRIIGDHDQVVLDRNETFGPERFDRTRGSQIYVRLPTGDLATGQYLLTIEAALGKVPVAREVRFQIK